MSGAVRPKTSAPLFFRVSSIPLTMLPHWSEPPNLKQRIQFAALLPHHQATFTEDNHKGGGEAQYLQRASVAAVEFEEVVGLRSDSKRRHFGSKTCPKPLRPVNVSPFQRLFHNEHPNHKVNLQNHVIEFEERQRLLPLQTQLSVGLSVLIASRHTGVGSFHIA
jgi:hypothetical protein